MTEADEPDQDVGAALRQGFEEASARVAAVPNAEAAFRSATGLRDEADRIVGQAATLRAQMALRVWQERGPMSLSQLAEVLGTSKARADQLLRVARAAAGSPEGPEEG